MGNFTDESVLMGSGDGGGSSANGVSSDNTSLEYPLQRDEVQTIHQKNNHVPKSESDIHNVFAFITLSIPEQFVRTESMATDGDKKRGKQS